MIGDGKAGGQYRADEFGLSSAMSTDEIAKSIRNLVEKRIVADVRVNYLILIRPSERLSKLFQKPIRVTATISAAEIS